MVAMGSYYFSLSLHQALTNTSSSSPACSVFRQVLMLHGTKKNTVAVIMQKKQVSKGLLHLDFKILLRNPFILVLILINNAPRSPPIIPKIIAPGNITGTLTV